jgi:hypothetical protein
MAGSYSSSGRAAAGASMSNDANYNYYGRNPHLRPYEEFRGPFVLKTRTAAKMGTGEEVLFGFTKEHPLSPECYAYFQEYLLFDREVVEADEGIYTWLIKQFKDGTQRVIAAPALSKQEVGTLHANLDGLTTDGTVLIAGELLIDFTDEGKKHFTYNILSGTYTMRLAPGDKSRRLPFLKEALNRFGGEESSYIVEHPNGGYQAILESAPVTLPKYAETNYQIHCGMYIRAFPPPTKRKRGGARRGRSRRQKGEARRRRTRRHRRR